MGELLVVDDDGADRELLIEAARSLPLRFSLLEASSATEGVRMAQERALPEARLVVLCDLGMPGLTGHSLISELRRDPVHPLMRVPILAWSGMASGADRARALRLGASAFVPKPDNLPGYVHLLFAIDAFWFGVAEVQL